MTVKEILGKNVKTYFERELFWHKWTAPDTVQQMQNQRECIVRVHFIARKLLVESIYSGGNSILAEIVVHMFDYMEEAMKKWYSKPIDFDEMVEYIENQLKKDI